MPQVALNLFHLGRLPHLAASVPITPTWVIRENKIVLGVLNDQNRTGRLPDNLLHHTASKQVLDEPQPMFAHDDQLDIQLRGTCHDLIGWTT